MPSVQEIRRYMNNMARALQIVEEFPNPFNQLVTCHGYAELTRQVRKDLARAWKGGLTPFFIYLEQFIEQIFDLPQKEDRYIQATAVVLWMDERLCYSANSNADRFSLYELIPLRDNHVLSLGLMNLNGPKTGIAIHPRMSTIKVWDQINNQARSLSNRDICGGIRGKLNNISYTFFDHHLIVHHLIAPFCPTDGLDTLRVAFCPIADSANLLKIQNTPIIRNGMTLEGIALEGLRYTKTLEANFRRDWRLASSKNAYICFGPEMLLTPAMAEMDGPYNRNMRQLCLDAVADGLSPPQFTVLPTCWVDGSNTAAIVNQNGRVLGTQPKYIPFVDQGANRVEALKEVANRHIYILHIPDVHRIAIMICADFLAIHDVGMSDLLCGQLGVTLILVPSYSHGEQDFVNLLPSLGGYGTTVFWGGCCGAVDAPRIVGACSVAGTDRTFRLGEHRKCQDCCVPGRSCVYLVDLPLSPQRAKPHPVIWDDPVRHCCLTN